jgi:glycerate 2-kinase
MAFLDESGARSIAEDARSIASRWREEMDLGQLSSALLMKTGLSELTVDVVAIGKASLEMTAAAQEHLGRRIRRRIAIVDDSVERRDVVAPGVFVGEHPVPGEGSLRAGRAVLDFLDETSDADATLFLISGGASSLCVVPAPPLSLDDLAAVWEAALRSGADITTLNMTRAAGSIIAGGAVLRHVRTARSESLILVDNVVSGAEWVASGMTYDFRPTKAFVSELWDRIGVVDADVRSQLLEGFITRAALMESDPRTQHDNAVVAEPAMMLEIAVKEAARRGYQVINMGADISGNVNDVAMRWSSAISEAPPRPVALVGVGEVTVKVRGTGEGGRCQEFAWLMAGVLANRDRAGAFVAHASDGQDHVPGVGGAWVDGETKAAARDQGLDWEGVAESHDTYPALKALGHLIEGGHTGWNLCDLYVAVVV